MNDIDTYLTRRVALEVASKEDCVLEAYLDSENVWTWGFGLTVASGHNPMRYRKKPATIERAVEVYIWALRRYAREVLDAFEGHALTPAQFAAALSFHWNTGKIGVASWVNSFKRGDMRAASAGFLVYNKPASIVGRRKKEHDLFFKSKWSGKGKVTVWGVHPNGKVDWSKSKIVDIGPAIDRAIAWQAGDGTIKDSEPVDTRAERDGEQAEPVEHRPAETKPVAKSGRFWTWLTSGGVAFLTGLKELNLVALDWRVQLAMLAVVVAAAMYAIGTMPAVRRLLGLST